MRSITVWANTIHRFTIFISLAANKKTTAKLLLTSDNRCGISRCLCLLLLPVFLWACATSAPLKPVVGREYTAEMSPINGTNATLLSLRVEAAKLNNQPVPPGSLAAVELSEFNQALVSCLATNVLVGNFSRNSSSNQADAVHIMIEFAESENFHAGQTGGKAVLAGLTLGLASPFLKHPYTYNSVMTLTVPGKEHVAKVTATGTATGAYVESEMKTGLDRKSVV